MRQKWKIIKSQGRINPTAFDEFVNSVIAYQATDKTTNKRTISDIHEGIDESQWLPWNEVEQKEGFDCLMEQVKAGTILTRRHTRLPPDSKVPWPKNQQVRYLAEIERNIKRTKEDEENVKEAETQEASENFDTLWSAKQLNMKPAMSTGSSSGS